MSAETAIYSSLNQSQIGAFSTGMERIAAMPSRRRTPPN
jgi:hypothetical protein